ncbi:bile acid:sodium symporter family protein [Neisseria sp. Ec49-e6-T10]|uniref:bile acid:sodium symporter family protein n=1 Tax=Neisseria sp. Ec49-e6-T10 TaxID=3140744 RepID=UPI003EB81DA8
MKWLKKLYIDQFLLILICVVIIASIFPCKGLYKTIFEQLTNIAIALLFFMHGAKLPRSAILSGLGNWRLHCIIFASTFILFPLLGLTMQVLTPNILSEPLYLGFLYLCALPATVQSAIAFTSVAKGNVAAAICSASASSILGIFLSPILVGLLMHTQGATTDTTDAILSIMVKLMLPFILGHLSRPLTAGWIAKHIKLVNKTDRSSILLVVYVAFSDAVVNGIWHQVNFWSLLVILLCSVLLLAVVLLCTTYGARLLGFNKEDEITIVFCGSKKSLANGIPMANVLFPASAIGLMVLPLMIFHQLQLMVCAVLAAHYAKRES